jgi:hypothetical protein
MDDQDPTLPRSATRTCTIKKGTPILGIAVASAFIQSNATENHYLKDMVLTPPSAEQVGGSLLFDLPCTSDSVYLKIDGREVPSFGASYTQRLPFTEAAFSMSYLSKLVRWLLMGPCGITLGATMHVVPKSMSAGQSPSHMLMHRGWHA